MSSSRRCDGCGCELTDPGSGVGWSVVQLYYNGTGSGQPTYDICPECGRDGVLLKLKESQGLRLWVRNA